jgi:hypothetical protein
MAVKQRGNDEDRWQLDHDVRAEEGERKHGSERKRCQGGWGWSSPFIGGRRVPGRVVGAVTVGIKEVNAIDG